jgi:hypothetical protein
MKSDLLLIIYSDRRSVFRLVDVAMLTGQSDSFALARKLNYYVKKGYLLNPRKGIYTRIQFSPEELACRIYSPAYLSLEYVLQKSGIVFQYDTQITLVSYLSRSITIHDQHIRFRKIRNPILANTKGIIQHQNTVHIATPERAFLDLLYLDPGFYFDNLHPLNKSVLYNLVEIYETDTLITRCKKLLKDV